MACRRSRGQPLLSKRHSVVIHKAAVSPLPCTKTMGGNGSGAPGAAPGRGAVMQPASSAASAASRSRRVTRWVIVVVVVVRMNGSGGVEVARRGQRRHARTGDAG